MSACDDAWYIGSDMITAATRKSDAVAGSHQRKARHSHDEAGQQRAPFAEPRDDRPHHRGLIDRGDRADEREREADAAGAPAEGGDAEDHPDVRKHLVRQSR